MIRHLFRISLFALILLLALPCKRAALAQTSEEANVPAVTGNAESKSELKSEPNANQKTSSSSPAKISTGFFVSDAGHLITALHAVEGYRDISVMLHDRRRLPAKLLRIDKAADAALLKVAAITPFIYLPSSDSAPAGMEIATIGYPNVAIQGWIPKITRGIVNSPRGAHDDVRSFQISADVNRGNSGGPVLSPNGVVVGMVRSKIVSTSGSHASSEPPLQLNFATRGSLLMQLIKDIPGLPSPRPVDTESPMRTVRIYSELKDAVVPVIAEGGRH